VLAWIKPVEGSVNGFLALVVLVGVAALGRRLWKRRSAGS
jgi:MYXO-CTERM domain-containing protein